MDGPRPELDGRRLSVTGRPDLWLVIHGVRRLIVSPAVRGQLFPPEEAGTPVRGLEAVRRGPDLNEGTCLVRGDGEDGGIYLLTGFPASEVRRHHITSWDSFLAFGFDLARVRVTPALMLSAVPVGRPISAADAGDLPPDLSPP